MAMARVWPQGEMKRVCTTLSKLCSGVAAGFGEVAETVASILAVVALMPAALAFTQPTLGILHIQYTWYHR